MALFFLKMEIILSSCVFIIFFHVSGLLVMVGYPVQSTHLQFLHNGFSDNCPITFEALRLCMKITVILNTLVKLLELKLKLCTSVHS